MISLSYLPTAASHFLSVVKGQVGFSSQPKLTTQSRLGAGLQGEVDNGVIALSDEVNYGVT